MRTPIGIDLGTTNALVAYVDGAKPQIIVNRWGQRSTPSVVGLDARGALDWVRARAPGERHVERRDVPTGAAA